MKMDDFVANESVRGWVYKLLADCYQRPDEEIAKKIIDLTDALKDICPLGASYTASLASKLQKDFNIDHIRLDYARLFIGPFAVPAAPYGSVYLEGMRQLMGNSTLDVLERYRNAGLKIVSDFNEPPDHIAVELEFMSFLIFKAIESSGNSDTKKMIACYESQKSFLEDHLGGWVFAFAEAVEKNAETGFYRNLAKATTAFLKYDCQVFSSILHAKHAEKTAEIESVGGHC